MLAKNEESAWQKASASLDATAKIYGFRVDSVHSETFKFLGGLKITEKIRKKLVKQRKRKKLKKGCILWKLI